MRFINRYSEKLLNRLFFRNYSHNLLWELQIRARDESVDYITKNMPRAMIWQSSRDIISHGIDESNNSGLIAEFGVASGGTINIISSLVPKNQLVYGFDSFEGLPTNWEGHAGPKAMFKQKTLPKVNRNVKLVVGLFEDTLPIFLKEKSEGARFIHIDCDLYSSTKTILNNFKSRIKPGTILLFDEYFNYPAWKLHEFKAWQEFCKQHGIQYKYLAFKASGCSVLLKVTKIK